MQKREQQTDPMDQGADPLLAIRRRIDAIDEQMHRLLIDRSGVIAELIEIKGTAEPRAAFRPDREADMMRRLAMRHEGALPLTAVEHVWREIITTFTAMQAPFAVACGLAEDALAMRDAVRFYFGFSIPVLNCTTNEAAIARVLASSREIAVVSVEAQGRWWGGLTGAKSPKIFARLPFIEVPDPPAGLPAYVIGPALKEPAKPDICVYAVAGAVGLEAAVLSHAGRIAGRVGDELLIELPVAATLDDLAREIGRPLHDVSDLGGFAQPIRFLSERTA